MQKIIFIGLICLILILYKQNHDNSFSNKFNQVLSATQILQESNEALEHQNDTINNFIIGLKASTLSVEMRKRYQLNLIKKDESLILIPAKYYK